VSARAGDAGKARLLDDQAIAGLIAESRGHYDQAEYDRQLQQGIRPAV
jgi:hypothetical protein